MIELVLVYCLAADPMNKQACVERRPTLDDSSNQMACMFQAQPLAAKYLEDHPKYVLSTWRCEQHNRSERGA
jgi:hypothetical protein